LMYSLEFDLLKLTV